MNADREEFIAGLRELAQYLEDHPDLPVRRAQVSPYLSGDDEWERTEVDRIAAILGRTPEQASPSHYRVERTFAGGVTYSAVAITEAHMAEWREFSDEFQARHTKAAPEGGEGQ